MFERYESITSAKIGRPMSLHRNHLDVATLKITFIYWEQAQDEDGIWYPVQDQEELVRNEHYRVDKRRGVVELSDHPFWKRKGHWVVADQLETLLYKGQIRWPQVLFFEYEHYVPEEIVVRSIVEDRGPERSPRVRAYKRTTEGVVTIDLEEEDPEVIQRLGYSLPRYTQAMDSTPEERGKHKTNFDWD